MNHEHHNDVIDLRDLIERFEELEEEETDLLSAIQDAVDARDALREGDGDYDQQYADSTEDLESARNDLSRWQQENAEEMELLGGLLEEIRGYGGDHQWRGNWYPVTLIADNYFRAYAEDLAEEIGAINGDARWPNNCIDWYRAADELKMDYSSVEFDGQTYWYRG